MQYLIIIDSFTVHIIPVYGIYKSIQTKHISQKVAKKNYYKV